MYEVYSRLISSSDMPSLTPVEMPIGLNAMLNPPVIQSAQTPAHHPDPLVD